MKTTRSGRTIGIWGSAIATALLVLLCRGEAQGAGTNPPLIKATGLLTFPTNGTVTLAVSAIGSAAATNFNVFGYGTATNFSAARWTVTLPPKWSSQEGVSNDAAGKLVYLNLRLSASGSLIIVR